MDVGRVRRGRGETAEGYFRGAVSRIKLNFTSRPSPTRFAAPPLLWECFIISSAYEWLFRGAQRRRYGA